MSIGGVRNLKKRGLSKYTFRTRNRAKTRKIEHIPKEEHHLSASTTYVRIHCNWHSRCRHFVGNRPWTVWLGQTLSQSKHNLLHYLALVIRVPIFDKCTYTPAGHGSWIVCQTKGSCVAPLCCTYPVVMWSFCNKSFGLQFEIHGVLVNVYLSVIYPLSSRRSLQQPLQMSL